MSTAALVQMLILSSVAVLLAFGVVAVVVGMSGASLRYRNSLFAWIFPIIGLAMAFGPLTSQRNLSLLNPFFEASYDEIGAARWVSRAFIMIALLIASERIFTSVVNRKRELPAGLGLLIGVLALYMTHYVVSAFLGERSSFSLYYVYPFLIFPAAYLVARADFERCISFCRTTLFWFLLASVAVAVVRPELVIQFRYTEGLIPGVSLRYWGLGSHANSLGPMVLLFLLCIFHRPFRRPLVQWFSVGLGVASLLATQSKTMWGAAVLAFAIMAVARLAPRLAADWKQKRLSLGVALIMVAAGVAAIGAVAFAAAMVNGQISSRLAEFAYNNNLTTLTGRNRIWAVALADWSRSPFFGYGPSWGDVEYRLSAGLAAAVHAHNQLIHSAASAGIFGLLSAIAYLGLLVAYAARSFARSGGFSAALVTVILAHSVTEVPLLTKGFTSPAMMWQLLTFLVLVGYAQAKPSPSASDARSRPPHQFEFSAKPTMS